MPSPSRRAAGPCLTFRDVWVAGWAGGAGPARSRRRAARGGGGCETRSAVRHGGGCSVPLKPLLVQAQSAAGVRCGEQDGHSNVYGGGPGHVA